MTSHPSHQGKSQATKANQPKSQAKAKALPHHHQSPNPKALQQDTLGTPPVRAWAAPFRSGGSARAHCDLDRTRQGIPTGRFWHGFAVLSARRDALAGPWAEGQMIVRDFAVDPERSGLFEAIGGMEPRFELPRFFTERTLAAYLAVSDRTIRNWIRRGELSSYKLGASRRIDPADVEDFLARHRDEAA